MQGMSKFDQLVEMVKMGVMISDMRAGTRKFLTVLPDINDVWMDHGYAAINECEDSVVKMASDYFLYLYNSGPAPAWLTHIE